MSADTERDRIASLASGVSAVVAGALLVASFFVSTGVDLFAIATLVFGVGYAIVAGRYAMLGARTRAAANALAAVGWPLVGFAPTVNGLPVGLSLGVLCVVVGGGWLLVNGR
jgi:hypothetical protein